MQIITVGACGFPYLSSWIQKCELRERGSGVAECIEINIHADVLI